jgi:CheY-like chemotaxis protein
MVYGTECAGEQAMSDILVADDDAMVREVLRQLLESQGWTVAEASNGREAIESFRRQPSQLLITDIIMPEDDGYETCLQLKRKHRNLKVIAISGGDFLLPGKYLALANGIGVDRTFAKPFKNAEIVSAVRELIGEPRKQEASKQA